MTPEPVKKPDWTKIEDVFALLETNGRTLTVGEKDAIAGQRRINGILFKAIDAMLQTFPNESAPPAIMQARDLLKDLPGQAPPGCEENPLPTKTP